MKRLRLLFALLAAGLLLPLGLLLRKALESVEVERSVRYRALAERILDEAERELTAWLRAEEDRPYDHYRFFYLPEGAAEGVALVRSPLAENPEPPFVVGYFQVDPDGSVSSPRWPGNETLARRETGWSPSEEARAELEAVRRAVSELWASAPGVRREPTPGPQQRPAPEAKRRALAGGDAGASQAAGTTVPLYQAKQKRLPRAEEKAEAESSLELLDSLNRGARSREQRDSKVSQSEAPDVYNFALDEDNRLQSLREPLLGEVEDEIAREVGAETVDVRLEPMVGRPAGAGRTLLYRTVTVGEKAYRQGVLIDDRALVAWLAERVLAGGELAARARLVPAGAEPPSGERLFRHRFAEPFGSVSAVLALGALPDPGGVAYLYALSALVALTATFGLFAAYRTVAVTVRFAERRSDFVSAVTHELKTPLTAIRMYGEMLRDGVVATEPKRREAYGVITAESERLGRLVQNVLELARLERSGRPPSLEVGEVGPVLEEVRSALGPHARSQGFELRLEVADGLPPVRYDRDALLQVLFNLVDNALKYAREAERKEVVIAARREGEKVVLEVRDRGPGVAGRHLRKIFEPFYRGESELTRTAKGTGIGLALVRGLVERMGGEVSGHNRRGGGFAVSVRLAVAA